jgi:outer membrane protein
MDDRRLDPVPEHQRQLAVVRELVLRRQGFDDRPALFVGEHAKPGNENNDNASRGQLTQPIYDGGTAASQTRQAKEVAAQSRLVLDQVRNQARTAAIGAWVANEGAKIAVAASESEVRAATVALAGVQKEAAGGQRTTVDVLNSQQDLISAKARLIGAQRDRVIASYTLLSAIGRLDVKTLALNTPDYLPEVHYHQVRDAWHGLRTPSGQ